MSKTALDCLLIGNESLLVQCSETLRERGHRVTGIVTENPAIVAYAARNGIGCTSWEHQRDHAENSSFDWLFSVANLRMLPDAMWRKAKAGAANFHDGPLPRYAGLNAPAWAILNGESTHGVTWHALTTGADEGDIYVQETFDISPDETALTLNTKCFEAGIATFGAMIDLIENGALIGKPQDFSDRTYFGRGRRPQAAGTLQFDRSAEELSRLVRALDFGDGYSNPLLLPKLRSKDGLYAVKGLTPVSDRSGATPGTILSRSEDALVIATGDQAVRVSGLRISDGAPLADTVRDSILQALDPPAELDLSQAVENAARHEDAYRRNLASAQDVDFVATLPFTEEGESAGIEVPVDLGTGRSRDEKLAILSALALRMSDQESVSFAYQGTAIAETVAKFPGYFGDFTILNIRATENMTVESLTGMVSTELSRLRERGAPLSDLPLRYPNMATPRLSIGIVDGGNAASLLRTSVVLLVLDDDGKDRLVFDRNRVEEAEVKSLAGRLEIVASAFQDRTARLSELPLMPDRELKKVLQDWNDTTLSYDSECVHVLFERQADRTPDLIAVASGGVELTYRQLDDRANQVANALVAAGVRPDMKVGLYTSRSVNLVVSALAIMKAGGAYVPLDPAFPAERLAYMIDDCGAQFTLTERSLNATLNAPATKFIAIEDVLEAQGANSRPATGVAPDNLAYMIYTSGSTGKPKGVMIEHRNVANFFAGMDDRIAVSKDRQPVWLAVTSLSFDISVLELFWTLARGFKVVIYSAEALDGRGVASRQHAIDFGLFYWGNDDGAGPEKYRLLLEGAKFADAHGFNAIWTPERHFHAFGGPYPNPAVTGAAVAAITKNLSIRAGSCVLPLHHPARVVEEWAIIDNISNGRVGLAFASGWMPEDFVLRPENAPPHNKPALLRDIEVVRRLWRGDSVDFPFGSGTVSVVTQPRPVQKELPIWVTSAGNPETYREAARVGANVLTHLLGQSVDELAEKIAIYRQTLVECGRDPASYKVTLMLHTLLGSDREDVRERAREPMKDYLRSATALIKQYAWAFPAFKKPQGIANPMDVDLQGLSTDELDAILEFAFLRYFEDSGLFGTVEDAVRRVEQVAAIGVNEIACLIDFGIPTATVLERLTDLAAVVAQSNRVSRRAPVGQHDSLPTLIANHRVTHIQCTPSMARMFLVDEESRQALKQVEHLFIGGEALSSALVVDLRKDTAATIENMYGPTETTIWSSTLTVKDADGTVPLGRPIANTQLYVLDRNRTPLPPGVAGELYIGGAGVARGYHNRPELTAERFLQNTFAPGRYYRTGDRVRFLPDGTLQFLGRADEQVKVRGYRIELGEIEARIAEFPGIAETVVVVREDRADDVRIVAYLRLADSQLDENALRTHLAESLPDYMVPAHFVTLDAFPLTPNAKVNRKALPRPDAAPRTEPAVYAAPVDNMQREIAETFQRILGLERVGLSDSFFALGGHSLLAVQAHRDLKARVAPDMAITDLFRFPTVGALAAHLSDRSKSDERLSKVVNRAAARRAALESRHARANSH